MAISAEEARARLRACLDGRLSEGARAFLDQQPLDDLEAVRRAMPQVGRAVGTRALVGAFNERDGATLEGTHGPFKVGHWGSDTASRVWLIASAVARTPAPHQALYETYEQGDTETRAACLRALNFVAGESAAVAMEMVHDAGRTYLEELMAAAWTHNPFSDAHLDDETYRKAYLKALFCNVPVDGFLNLERRADAAMAQSLCEYADERLAAGRPVPDPVWIVAAMHPRPGLVARLVGMLEHPLPEQRIVAAKALTNARDRRAAPFIEERLAREPDEPVKAALGAAFAASGK